MTEKFPSTGRPRIPIEDRFRNLYKVCQVTGCWLWTGKKHKSGYGLINRPGRGNGQLLAHRVSYNLFVGSIPYGMDVLHECDTPACVRPDCFFLGTQQDNMKDKVNKNRQTKGTDIHNSKLDSGDVLDIRNLLDEGVKGYEVADMYSVHPSCISKINTGKLWSHI